MRSPKPKLFPHPLFAQSRWWHIKTYWHLLCIPIIVAELQLFGKTTRLLVEKQASKQREQEDMSLRWMGSLDMYRKVSFCLVRVATTTGVSNLSLTLPPVLLKGAHGPHGRDETRKLPEFDIFGSHVHTLPLGNEGIFSIRVCSLFYTPMMMAIVSALVSITHPRVFFVFI